jgi:hypothetical protein
MQLYDLFKIEIKNCELVTHDSDDKDTDILEDYIISSNFKFWSDESALF